MQNSEILVQYSIVKYIMGEIHYGEVQCWMGSQETSKIYGYIKEHIKAGKRPTQNLAVHCTWLN